MNEVKSNRFALRTGVLQSPHDALSHVSIVRTPYSAHPVLPYVCYPALTVEINLYSEYILTQYEYIVREGKR